MLKMVVFLFMTKSLNFDHYFIITCIFALLYFFQGIRVEEVQGTMVCEVFTQRLASKKGELNFGTLIMLLYHHIFLVVVTDSEL